MVETMRALFRCLARAFHAPEHSLINTGALARCKGGRVPWKLFQFQQFIVGHEKPLKRFVRRTVSMHRAKATVLMKYREEAYPVCGFAILVALLLLPSAGLAHRLDEYLQATLVTIDPGELRLQINLTPGVEVADKVLAVVDRNHDGVISTNEASAYCELLKRDLTVYLDGHKVALKPGSSSFPALTELRTGWGIMQVEFSAPIGSLAAGEHRLEVKNRHLPHLSVYLFNAAQPSSGLVQVTKQKRNKNQSMGEIEFTVQSSHPGT